MVDQPNNYGSIVGGIIRGLSNDRRSAGLTGHNVTNDNPQSYAWIGQNTSDLRQPIQKEMSQNPSLPFEKGSSGTQYEYTNPLPTDIRSLVRQGYPGTDVNIVDQASSVGSLVQGMPSFVPINNLQLSGYGMSPQNADHFKYYFANQMGQLNLTPQVNPSNVLTAVQEHQNINTDGSAQVWHGAFQTFGTMLKRYNPANSFRGQ